MSSPFDPRFPTDVVSQSHVRCCHSAATLFQEHQERVLPIFEGSSTGSKIDQHPLHELIDVIYETGTTCDTARSATMPESNHLREVDVAIVGGGPAGLTAAVYLRRFLRSVVVFDAGDARAELIPVSHNCPGFPEGISGRGLLRRLRQHANEYGAEIIQGGVERIERNNRSFTVSTEFGAFAASRVILATGIVDKAPAIAGLRNAIAMGSVRLCPVCDAYEAKGKRIGVAGPEKAALNEALFLRTYSSHVVMLANKPADISEGTRTKARAEGIEVWDTVEDVVLKSPGLGVVMAAGCGTRMLDVVYPAMGCDVRSQLASNIGANCDDDGYILVGPHLEASVPGLYAIGDVARALNQIAVGFGHAALAAAHIHNALRA